jgi:hypothetical protein
MDGMNPPPIKAFELGVCRRPQPVLDAGQVNVCICTRL